MDTVTQTDHNNFRNQNYKISNIKYPKEIAAFVRNQTFYVNAELTKPDYKKGDSPLELYHSKFSRFPFNIINADKKAAAANINISDAIDIIAKSKVFISTAYQKELDDILSGKKESEKNLSPAYTVKMTSGFFKGRTPAQVILENSNNIQKLYDQFQYLGKYMGKYPNNKVQMTAIKEAIELYNSGNLKNAEAGTSAIQTVNLYNSGFRPLTRKKRDDGMCFIYQIDIVWHFGSKYPVEVTIQNYYAPVTKNETGMLNVQFNQRDKESLIKNTMNLSTKEWNHTIYMMEANMKAYENMVSGEMIQASHDALWNNQKQ